MKSHVWSEHSSIILYRQWKIIVSTSILLFVFNKGEKMSGKQRFDYLVKLLLIGDSGTCHTTGVATIFLWQNGASCLCTTFRMSLVH